MFAGEEVEYAYAEEVYAPGGPKCGVVADVLSYDTANQDSQAYADIPRYEECRVCRAAL